MAAHDIVSENVRNSLQEAGIDIPFPMRTVLFHDQTDEDDGDRSRQREGWAALQNGDTPGPARLGMAFGNAQKPQKKMD